MEFITHTFQVWFHACNTDNRYLSTYCKETLGMEYMSETEYDIINPSILRNTRTYVALHQIIFLFWVLPTI